MKIIKDIDNLDIVRTIVTLGKFDGNHIGHTLLFNTAIRIKNENIDNQKDDEQLSVVIFTFDIPVSKIVNNKEINSIYTTEERLLHHYSEGIDYLVIFPFNETTRNMSPEDFVVDVLVNKLHVHTIVVGEDFCFGKNRSGNVDTLKYLGEKYLFNVSALKKVMYKPSDYDTPQEVSSTLIKEELLKGNIEDANNMLGEPFHIKGKVVYGKQLGQKIGFPTINVEVSEDKLLPPNGVYATKTVIKGKEYLGITNIGTRPTFDDGENRSVENNLFDFSQDVYGEIAEVRFYKFIRPETKFDSPDDLVREINDNVETVKKMFSDLQ